MSTTSHKRRRGYMSLEAEATVDVGVDEVIEFINDYASQDDLEQIHNVTRREMGDRNSIDHPFYDLNPRHATLEDVMKAELLNAVFKKFSLTELEEKLGGTKFDFM